ncbi:MAG: hypothetical protein U0359_13145 [Byssovorax sp.]
MAGARRSRAEAPTFRASREEPKQGLARHLEGWKPAVFGVLLAGSTAALVLPRPVEPREIPEPRVDTGALSQVEARDDARAAEADRTRLDVDVLALGTALFSYGEVDAGPNHTALDLERRNVLVLAARALALGPEPILALRAHHLRSFLREVRRFEQTGEVSEKLTQVAGGFLRRLQQNGWLDGRRVLFDPSALRAAYKKHWNDVVDLRGAPFDLSLDEQRALYRFLILHPIAARSPLEPDLPPLPPDPTFRERLAPTEVTSAVSVTQAQYRLKKVEELRALDPSYPADLARGVVLYQMARYPLAVECFRRHNEAFPDGPYALRVQNYLLASLAKAQE